MPFPKKDKIRKMCGNCFQDYWVRPWKAKRGTKFCSKKCKSEFHSKGRKHWYRQQQLWKKCENPFCKSGTWTLKWERDRGMYKYCSRTCVLYCKSHQFKLDFKQLQEKKQDDMRRNIWRLNF